MLDTLRRRVLPFAVWCGVMGTAGWLWLGMRSGGPARGYVEGIAYDVTTLQPGRIASIAVVPGQRVRGGQIIARLDERELDAELQMLDAQRLRAEADLRAMTSQTELQVGKTMRQIEESVDSADFARKQARADRSVQAAELAALERQVDAVRDLVDKRMADRRDLDELTVDQAALRKQLQVSESLIRQLDAQAASARARRSGLPADATVQATDPLRAKLDIITTQQQLLALRKQLLALRAPGSGEVSAVHLRPGENAALGTPVVTITGPAEVAASGTPIVFVCTTEATSASVRVGEAVELSPPEGGGTALVGHVQRLAAAVEALPERCWTDPRIPVWGRGIYVAIDEPVSLLPGQSFAIEFTGRMSDVSEPAQPPVPAEHDESPAPSPTPSPTRPADPLELPVPATLRAVTRFEPSGIVWSETRRRYFLVSDDTGFAKVDEHAPLLFSMDEHGVLDGTPLRLGGIDSFSDLESIAAAPDGGLYLLASQSRSRKGKRSKARQVFAHVAFDGEHGANVDASVSFAALLDDAADVRRELGLADTDALDIEGMTATRDGGLLLGLKGPLDADGSATIWHMATPDALLAKGELAAAGLTMRARVPLIVRVNGTDAPAGIAELLELPDGELLIAATAAASDEPASQDGALFVLGDATPKLVRSFPGLKPEGLSRNRSGDGIVIVFDTAAANPWWMEQRWPAP